MSYVSLHTTGDGIVEVWQQPRYRIKASLNGSIVEHGALPIFRYRHCNFEDGDLTAGVGLPLIEVAAANPELVADAMPRPASSTFWELVGN